jgi:hypothetical protein
MNIKNHFDSRSVVSLFVAANRAFVLSQFRQQHSWPAARPSFAGSYVLDEECRSQQHASPPAILKSACCLLAFTPSYLLAAVTQTRHGQQAHLLERVIDNLLHSSLSRDTIPSKDWPQRKQSISQHYYFKETQDDLVSD